LQNFYIWKICLDFLNQLIKTFVWYMNTPFEIIHQSESVFYQAKFRVRFSSFLKPDWKEEARVLIPVSVSPKHLEILENRIFHISLHF